MIYVHSMERALWYHPQHPAWCLGQNRLSFRELHEQVKGVAATLTHLGFEPGDRLALLLPNGLDYIKFVYACSWLGVIVVPINTRLSSAEINRVLEDACPRGLIRHSALAAPTASVPWELVLDQQTLHQGEYTCPDPCYQAEAILALIYTSGTTGQPKGVMVTHANILANVHHFNYWMRYREGGLFLHASPMFHIADFPAMFAAPAFGTCQTALPAFSPAIFCETVSTERVNCTVLVPTMINLLTQLPEIKKFDLSSLAVLAYGGSPMAPELVFKSREILPNAELVQVYGLSETGLLSGLEDKDHAGARLLSCGRPCPGIDLRITDESGKRAGSGEQGELVVRGANVTAGYWNNREDTAAAFRDGFFRTGDIGYQDAGGYFYILDRVKDMIVTGGENVYCGEVEAVILTHHAVREAAVFGIPDPKWGELVAVCVVVKPGMNMTADELMCHCRKSLANYKIPGRVEFLETDLPKSGSGKVLKRLLRERFWASKERAVS
jgi:acyl-CoA synthetase (AMP-forming)/AMP-acid ligase II